MPGLVPGIHVLTVSPNKDMDGRDKPGHDGEKWWRQCPPLFFIAASCSGVAAP